MDEKVLVVPENIFLELGGKPGISREGHLMLSKQKFRSSLFYLERSKAENDSSFKQIIPYCVIRFPVASELLNMKKGLFFIYQRTKKGGESRLHDKYSIGVGGHVSECDGETSDSIEKAMLRELQEEVSLDGNIINKTIGMIYDDSNEVGKVHLGIVQLIDLGQGACMKMNDPALDKGDFVDYDWLIENVDKFENWSQFVIKELL